MDNIICVNEKAQNPKLSALLAKYKTALASDKKAAVEILGQVADELALRARVLVPVNLSEEPVSKGGKLVVNTGSNVELMMLSGDGRNFLPIFTDNAEFDKWNAGDSKPPYNVTLDFDSFASVLESNPVCWGLTVNPFSDNITIPRAMVLNWFEQKQIHSQGHARHVITPDTPTEVFTPDPYPMQLSNILCETAKKLPGVNKLWLRGVRLNGSEGHLLIADLSEDGNKAIFPALGEASKPYLNGLPLHIVTVDSEFGISTVENLLPIYTKNA